MGESDQLTRDAARAAAEAWAEDPSTVEEFVAAAFNADLQTGGYAFTCDRGVYIAGFDGATSWSIEPGSEEGRRSVVDDFWAAAKHRNRPLDLEALTGFHRVAITALVAGVPTVGELPAEERVELGRGEDAIAHADYLLVHLSRRASEPTEAAALHALAANDWLLSTPKAVHQRAHDCPICGRPALGGPRYLTAVCDACWPQTTCRHVRTIAGNNTSLSGGFEARHVDDDSICDQATTDHRCWIGVRECRIAEAYMGGVVVTAVVKPTGVDEFSGSPPSQRP